ncbi:MAG: type IV pilus secretin PilQ [Gammaproteobacteria bacterium]|nr:type IV pilus secretin PilQ [Gammaproteobacteria bacterium]
MHRMCQKYLFIGLILFSLLLLPNLAAKAIDNQAHQSPLISLNFQKISVRNILQILAEHTGKNIILSDKITGDISLHLENVTWQHAFQVILATRGLAKKESGTIIFVAPLNEMTNLEQTAQQFTEPATIGLKYASAEELAKALKPSGLLSANAGVGADQRTNTLIVADQPTKVLGVKQLLQAIDTPVKQVMITAKIVSADDNFSRELGVKFGTLNNNSIANINNGRNDLNSVAPAFNPGQFDFTLAKLENDVALNLELTALENEGRGSVISSPKLLTLDRQAAYIESGSEIPYQEKSNYGATSVAFKKAVLSLKVTPEIISKNKINLILQLNQDKVAQLNVNGVPAIDTRQIQTQVLVNNGETVVLGGIYEWSKSKAKTSMPFINKIPIVGSIFQSSETKLERKELLMFITPRIIAD